MILIQLNDYEDAFCLALASRYFWHVSRPYIQMFLMNSAPHYDCDSQYFGSWEGERLICINERTDSYPSRLVPRAAYIPRPEKLMRVSEEDYSTAGWQGLPRLQRVKYFMLATLPEPERSQAFDLAAKPLGNLTKKAFLPNDRVWILRNLSTQEYVRADKFAKSPGQIDGPHIKPFGFGEILCSRICWSSKHLPRGINRGVWAGHRLDITTLDRWTKSGRSSKEGKNPEGWKDISEEVAKDMDEIWSSLFG
jgi:hypothetical protein